MIKMIFFDLDETLIDIKYAQNLGCELLYNKYNFSKATNLKGFIAKWDELTKVHYDIYLQRKCSYEEQRIRRIVDLFHFYNIDIKEIDALEYYNEYMRGFENSWILYDDVIPILDVLFNKYKLGIITNGDVTQQTQKLTKTGILKYFTTVVAAGEFDFSKPDPRIFKIACERSDVKYEECCCVGDSYRNDVAPCKLLGIHGIYLNRNGKSIDDSDVIQIDSLSEIEGILKEL